MGKPGDHDAVLPPVADQTTEEGNSDSDAWASYEDLAPVETDFIKGQIRGLNPNKKP